MSETHIAVSDAWREYAEGSGRPVLENIYEGEQVMGGRDSERRCWRRHHAFFRAQCSWPVASRCCCYIDGQRRGQGISLLDSAERFRTILTPISLTGVLRFIRP